MTNYILMLSSKHEYSVNFLPRKIKEIKKGYKNLKNVPFLNINIYLFTFFIKSLTNFSFSSAVSET